MCHLCTPCIQSQIAPGVPGPRKYRVGLGILFQCVIEPMIASYISFMVENLFVTGLAAAILDFLVELELRKCAIL